MQVKKKVADGIYWYGKFHNFKVMKYGNFDVEQEKLALFFGADFKELKRQTNNFSVEKYYLPSMQAPFSPI